jgi:hypothetical protein
MYRNNTQNALLCYHGNTFSTYYNVDSDLNVNPTKSFCVFMATMVMPTHHNVMLYIKFLLVFGAINITK